MSGCRALVQSGTKPQDFLCLLSCTCPVRNQTPGFSMSVVVHLSANFVEPPSHILLVRYL